MPKNVLVVESPAKAKTINRYLGGDFIVLASYGHVRDLVPKDGAVDTEHDFSMEYEVVSRNAKHVKAIADALVEADTLYLATDPDREGEAISWHILELLKKRKKLGGKNVSRVVFNEITQTAIKKAIENARDISMDMVNAQQARRALDFLVGFNLSPLLWRKVRPGLSAGRVQSPALRLICQREEEIESFVSKEYWTIAAELGAEKKQFDAKLTELDTKKLKQFDINNEVDSKNAVSKLKTAANGTMTVKSVEKKERKRHPSPPFITSTLQQEAARKLGFGATRTMRLAQQLYEGVKVGSETVGLITYMRTDSVSLSNDAIGQFRHFIEGEYGKDFLPDTPKRYKTKSKNAQEAHEAIRPTGIKYPPKFLKGKIDNDLWRLYDLVWKRAIASQMIHATMDTVAIQFDCGGTGVFKSTGSTIKHAGFIILYTEGRDDSKAGDDNENILPPLSEGDTVSVVDIAGTQHFTEPPPRYTEASLVKVLEEYDIGRPSTYASIIQTLLNREYVLSEQRRLYPTMMGKIVNLFLTKHFSRYVDYEFTANLEDQLDAVSRGEKDWIPLMREFWDTFSKNVEDKKDVSREEVMQARELGTDPKSGKPVSVRYGRYGPFVQIGTKDDEEKPLFASLIGDMKFDEVDLESALELFKLPLNLGDYEGHEVEVNEGRYGPYVKYDGKFISLGRGVNPLTVSFDDAVEAIVEKQKADAPIAEYEDIPVQKGVGRFGPFLKWNGIFINVNKKYDFDNLSQEDIVELIEDKKRKEREKVIHNWEDAGIRVEKARWGRFNIIKGKTKVEVAKDFDVQSLTPEAAQKLIDAKKPAKKTAAKKTTTKKTTTKKAATKKTAAKKATSKKATTKTVSNKT
ncbi:MAG: type I DNA topoisomerase [Gammaproteobacteria bacterium]|nr:type I DNA topoisomerase [Gammaproteobacteria bacterium]